jgi:retron-type reverse transcriptase
MEGCFDSIPHDKLMACARMRVVDGSVLRLIEQWLDAVVEEKDDRQETLLPTAAGTGWANQSSSQRVVQLLPTGI